MGFRIKNNVLKKYEPEEGITEVAIPDGVTAIGDLAFEWCKCLTSITIPAGVTNIGEYAFYRCENLTSITIPDSTTSIGNYAFRWCNHLESMQFGNTILKIAGISNFERELTNAVGMMKTRKFSKKVHAWLKYPLILEDFQKTSAEDASAYLQRNHKKLTEVLIDTEDMERLEFLLTTCPEWFKKKTIMEVVEYAIAHTRNGGNMEIQVMLMQFQAEHFGAIEPDLSL